MLFITNLSLLIKITNIAKVDISRQVANFKLSTFQKNILKASNITFFSSQMKIEKQVFLYEKKT